MTNECLQRIRITIRELTWSDHVIIHSEFNNDLKNMDNDIKATLTGYKRLWQCKLAPALGVWLVTGVWLSESPTPGLKICQRKKQNRRRNWGCQINATANLRTAYVICEECAKLNFDFKTKVESGKILYQFIRSPSPMTGWSWLTAPCPTWRRNTFTHVILLQTRYMLWS